MDVGCRQSLHTGGNDPCPGMHQPIPCVGIEDVGVRVEPGTVVGLFGRQIGPGRRKRGNRRRCVSAHAAEGDGENVLSEEQRGGKGLMLQAARWVRKASPSAAPMVAGWRRVWKRTKRSSQWRSACSVRRRLAAVLLGMMVPLR
jgi:hypothetical protein